MALVGGLLVNVCLLCRARLGNHRTGLRGLGNNLEAGGATHGLSLDIWMRLGWSASTTFGRILLQVEPFDYTMGRRLSGRPTSVLIRSTDQLKSHLRLDLQMHSGYSPFCRPINF
jgi:hypothetical protein